MKCPHCLGEIPSQARVCKHCGRRLSVSPVTGCAIVVLVVPLTLGAIWVLLVCLS